MAVTELILVRHGESIGNVAREEAESSGALSIAMPMRDPDVPLSELGERQARAVGQWLAADPRPAARPRSGASPYLRARQTAQFAARRAGRPRRPSGRTSGSATASWGCSTCSPSAA